MGGERLEPETVESNWQEVERNGEDALLGEFSYQTDGYAVEKDYSSQLSQKLAGR